MCGIYETIVLYLLGVPLHWITMRLVMLQHGLCFRTLQLCHIKTLHVRLGIFANSMRCTLISPSGKCQVWLVTGKAIRAPSQHRTAKGFWSFEVSDTQKMPEIFTNNLGRRERGAHRHSAQATFDGSSPNCYETNHPRQQLLSIVGPQTTWFSDICQNQLLMAFPICVSPPSPWAARWNWLCPPFRSDRWRVRCSSHSRVGHWSCTKLLQPVPLAQGWLEFAKHWQRLMHNRTTSNPKMMPQASEYQIVQTLALVPQAISSCQ